MSAEGKAPNVYGISRELWDHEVFAEEPYTEKQAWAWLLGQAAWKDCTKKGNTGNPVQLKRAEFSIAVRFLGEKWQWTKDRVHRFLGKLKKHDMIRDASRDSFQIYFINNYNDYQVVGVPKRDSGATPSATAARQPRDKEETVKQDKGKKESKPPKGAAAPVLPGLEFPPWWPTTEWAAFAESRRKMKKPLTDHAVQLAINRLTELKAQGEDPRDVLNRAIFGSWTGLYGRNDNRPGAPAPSNVVSFADVKLDGWVSRLEVFYLGDAELELKAGFWREPYGPAPGQRDCKVPDEAFRIYELRHGPIKNRASG